VEEELSDMNGICILLVWSAIGLNLAVQSSNNIIGNLAQCFLPAARSSMINPVGDSYALRDDKDQIVIRDEWIWAAPTSQKMTAAYMVIENHGSNEIDLVSASSDAARVVELHKMELEDGFMRMRKIDSIKIPDGGIAELKPGGYHLMVIDLNKELKEGDKVSMTLQFTQDIKKTIALTAKPRRETEK